MKVKGIIFEDFVNYKKPAMVIEMPKCNFKCDKECGRKVCQNEDLANSPNITVDEEQLVLRYLRNPITEAVVFQGLEPFDSFKDMLSFIKILRQHSDDDIVIYTGYEEPEIRKLVQVLIEYKNIIIKFGRFIPDQKPHIDDVLGIKLASSNQYARRIS